MCNHTKHKNIDKPLDIQLISLYCFNEGENILQNTVNIFPIFLKMLTIKLSVESICCNIMLCERVVQNGVVNRSRALILILIINFKKKMSIEEEFL